VHRKPRGQAKNQGRGILHLPHGDSKKKLKAKEKPLSSLNNRSGRRNGEEKKEEKRAVT